MAIPTIASEVLMKGIIKILMMAFLPVILMVTSLHAAGPWEIVSKSPGNIECAIMGSAGEIYVLEQLRFQQSFPGKKADIVEELELAKRMFVSEGGGTYAAILYEGQGEVVHAEQLTIFSGNNQKLWSISNHPLNDVVPLESGGAVGIHRNINIHENDLYFFGGDGELLKQFSIPVLGEVKASSSGDRILVNSGVRGAILFDASGEELAELGPAYRMFLSDDGRWTAILYGPDLTVYHDGRATYKGQLGGEIVRWVRFSPDNSVIAAITDHAFFLLKNPGRKVLLQRQLDPVEQFSYTSVDVTREGELVALGIERDLGSQVKGPERHPDGKILLCGKDGETIYHKSVSYSRWNTTTPRVKFSVDGKILLVLTRDEVIKAAIADLSSKGGVR